MENFGEPLRLYTLKEVAERLHISLITLQRDVRADRISHVRRGRQRLMTAAQIEALIEKHTRSERTPVTPSTALNERLTRMVAKENARRKNT